MRHSLRRGPWGSRPILQRTDQGAPFCAVLQLTGHQLFGQQEKKKSGPSRCGLADLIPGGAAAVKPIAAYDAYEGRAATAPGQRRQASGAAAEGGGVTKEEAVFSVRWVGAKNLPTSTEAVDKGAASRVIKRGMISTGGAAPGSLMPSKYSAALPVF